MFKFAHIADAHLGFRQYGLDERRKDFEKAFEYAIDVCIEEKVDFVLIAGDLFHHKNPDFSDIDFACNQLSRFKENHIPVYAIFGNHDAPSRTDKSNWTEDFLKRGLINNGRFAVHTQVRGHWINIVTQNWAGNDTEKYIRKPAYVKGYYNILVLHGGPTSENIVGQFHINTLKEFKNKIQYIALGHMHEPSIVDGFIVTPGSLEANSLTEWKYNNRGICIVTVENDLRHTIKQVPIPNRKTYYKKINWYYDYVDFFSQLIDVPSEALMHLDIVGTTELPIKPIQLTLIERKIREKYNPVYLSILNKTRIVKSTIDSSKEISKSNVFDLLVSNKLLAQLCLSVKEGRADADVLDKVITDYVNQQTQT